VLDVDTFVVTVIGLVEGFTGLTGGTVYYLSDAVAGELTDTEPTDVGTITKPVLIADSATSGYVFNMRGAVVPDPSAFGGITGPTGPTGPGGGGVTAVNQTTHGFAVGDVIRNDGVNTYAKAQANSEANAEVVGIVTAVADANNFSFVPSGYVTGLSGLTAETVYFLSPSSAGAITTTAPSTVGQVVKPVLIAVATTAGVFSQSYLGALVGDAESVIPETIIDAKGDLIAGTAADTAARVAVGSTNGMVLEVASGATPGIQWDLPSGWEYDYVERTTNVTVSATTGAGATTVLTGNSVTYTAVPILIEVFLAQVQPAADDSITVVIYDGSTELGIIGSSSSVGSTTSTDTLIVPFYASWRLTPTAASHQYGVRAYRGSSNGTVVAGSGAAGASMPSFIRVTKV